MSIAELDLWMDLKETANNSLQIRTSAYHLFQIIIYLILFAFGQTQYKSSTGNLRRISVLVFDILYPNWWISFLPLICDECSLSPFLYCPCVDLRPHCVWELHRLSGAWRPACGAQPVGHIRWGLCSDFYCYQQLIKLAKKKVPNFVEDWVKKWLYSWADVWNLFTLPTTTQPAWSRL